MPYFNALMVDSSTRKAYVDNLDSNTQYLMRVAAVNYYGTQPSETIAVSTKGIYHNYIHVKLSLSFVCVVPVFYWFLIDIQGGCQFEQVIRFDLSKFSSNCFTIYGFKWEKITKKEFIVLPNKVRLTKYGNGCQRQLF